MPELQKVERVQDDPDGRNHLYPHHPTVSTHLILCSAAYLEAAHDIRLGE